MGFFFGKESTITSKGRAVFKMMKDLNGLEVYAGYDERSGSYETNGKAVTVAQVAAFNEFGTENIPSRPFMRNAFKKSRKPVKKLMRRKIWEQIKGNCDAKAVLDSAGVLVKAMLQEEIRDGEYAPNAPSTIAKKGSDHPLIDTGRMRQSVVYKINKK